MSESASRVAAEAALFLAGRTADDLGWPDRACVARQFAAALMGGLGPAQWVPDPVMWCIAVLEPAIERRMPGPSDDLRALGWPHAPTVAARLVQWLVEDGILTD